MKLDIQEWNKTPKPEECNVEAKEGDIVITLDGVLFLLQREKEFNNIVCFRQFEGIFPIREVFFRYALIINDMNIRYVRIEGSLKRYLFLEREFPSDIVVRDNDVKDRNVFYVDLTKARPYILRYLYGRE